MKPPIASTLTLGRGVSLECYNRYNELIAPNGSICQWSLFVPSFGGAGMALSHPVTPRIPNPRPERRQGHNHRGYVRRGHPIIASGLAGRYRGKFVSAPWPFKSLNRNRFSPGSANRSLNPALFIDGKFHQQQTPLMAETTVLSVVYDRANRASCRGTKAQIEVDPKTRQLAKVSPAPRRRRWRGSRT
jgi:hypothetical protein